MAAAPSWLEGIAPAPVPQAGGDDGVGIRWLLLEGQTRLEGGSLVRYRRQVRRIGSAAGVQDGSDVRITFDPTFQRVTLHHIRLHRQGRALDALRPGEIKVIQRERDLDARIYSGSLTLVAFLKDVRAGDVVDVAWSVEGQHPTLQGQLTEGFDLGAPFPVERLYHRLVVPKEMALKLRAYRTDAKPTVRERGASREYVWDLKDVTPVDADDRAPAWFDPWPWVQASSFPGWSDVVAWALPLYDAKGATGGALFSGRLEALASHASAKDRLLAATRFVEDEVRYLGIEVGAESLKPRRPEEVLAQRFGDCKDKSLLLVSLLRALDIDADPALVHSYMGPSLEGMLPSPAVFNHVIVRAVVDGEVYWIDTTEGRTRVDTGDLAPPGVARALVLRRGEDALRVVPAPALSAPEVEVKERFRLKRYDRPAVLEVETTYRGAAADQQRRYLQGTSRERVEKNALNFYAKRHAAISLSTPLRVEDDREANVLVIHERYRIPGFWQGGGHTFQAWEITSRLQSPAVVRRTTPLAVAHPAFVRHEILLHLPDELPLEDAELDLGDEALRFSFRSSYEGRVLRLRYDLKTLRDHVAPEDTAAHLETLERIHEGAHYSVGQGLPPADGAAQGGPSEDDAVLFVLGLFGGCFGAGACAGGALGFLGGLLVP